MKHSLDVLKDEKAPVIAVVSVILRKFGVECMEWQPELMRDEIEDEFNLKITDLQSDKLQAGFTIMISNLFEAQWEVFKTVSHLLNNTPDGFEDVTPLEAEELATALAHYRLILGADEEKGSFSDEVLAYAGVVFYHYGMSEAPAIFQNALMPASATKSDPYEKNQALSELYNAKTKEIQDYIGSMSKL